MFKSGDRVEHKYTIWQIPNGDKGPGTIVHVYADESVDVKFDNGERHTFPKRTASLRVLEVKRA